MDKPHVAALRRAISIAGSQATLAAGISKYMRRPTFKQQTVSKWLRDKMFIAAEYWPAIEHVTARQVTRSDLRPDVFGSEKAA